MGFPHVFLDRNYPTWQIVERLKRLLISSVGLFLWVSFSCSSPTLAANLPTSAQATIGDLTGKSQIQGSVSFSQTPEGLLVNAKISGAPPGLHGFHIHEVGSCDDTGNAAKGHFNPDKVKHGNLAIDGLSHAHAGDLGNILIFSDGTGSTSETIPGLTLTQSKYAIADRAVILHANRDDFGQPTGNAGGRIGCGKIVLSSSSNE